MLEEDVGLRMLDGGCWRRMLEEVIGGGCWMEDVGGGCWMEDVRGGVCWRRLFRAAANSGGS